MITAESKSGRTHKIKRSLLILNPAKTKQSLPNLNLEEGIVLGHMWILLETYVM